MKRLILLLCCMGAFAVSAQERASAPPGKDIEFKLHPNPVYDGVVFIESSQSGPRTVRIYDLFGKVVLEERFNSDKLRLGSLVPGVYMVQLQQEDLVATKKLVIR